MRELPIRPKKGHLLITDRYPGTLRHQLVELGYVSSAHASSGTSVAFNAQPRPTGQVFLGSSRQFDTLDPQVEGPVLARMLRRALDYLPGLAGLNAIRAWTGFRAATPDGLPLLGEHPAQPSLWLAVGHEGLGVTTAPGSARLLAAQLFGETPPLDPTPYLPQRFLSSSGCPAMIELFIDRRPLRVAVGTSVAAALALGGDGCSAARSAAGGARRSAAWARARNAGY